jgi:hypothetical protein
MGHKKPQNGPYLVHISKLQKFISRQNAQKICNFLVKTPKQEQKSSFWSHFFKKSEIVSKTTKNTYSVMIFLEFGVKNQKIRSHFSKKKWDQLETTSKTSNHYAIRVSSHCMKKTWDNRLLSSLQTYKISPQPR